MILFISPYYVTRTPANESAVYTINVIQAFYGLINNIINYLLRLKLKIRK